MTPFPVIRLELESMQHAICAAFSSHLMQQDVDIKAAVADFCRPENLRLIVNNQVKTVLKAAIDKEVHDFYTYGAGRKVIKEAVQKRLAADIELLNDFQ